MHIKTISNAFPLFLHSLPDVVAGGGGALLGHVAQLAWSERWWHATVDRYRGALMHVYSSDERGWIAVAVAWASVDCRGAGESLGEPVAREEGGEERGRVKRWKRYLM